VDRPLAGRRYRAAKDSLVLEPTATLAGAPATSRQRAGAVLVCVLFAAATIAFAPFADRPWPSLAGFVPAYQVLTAAAYLITAYLLYADFRESGSRSLLWLAGGCFYTAAVLIAQLLSIPGLFGPSRLLGGPQTTIWLWMWWHLGPPCYALGYAISEKRHAYDPIASEDRTRVLSRSLGCVLAITVAVLASVTALHDRLPELNRGADFRLINTTGVAPFVTALTLLAALVVWRTTRARSLLQLWLLVSLVALVLDNGITMLGGMRDSVGWYVGRLEALASAWMLALVFLREVGTILRRLRRAARDLADANESLKAEAERRQATEEVLRQSQKMEAVGQLTGGVAHDFNNLLTVIIGSLDELKRHPEKPERTRRLVDAAMRAATRGERLTKRLLMFSRRQALNPSVANLNQLLGEFEPLIQRTLTHSISLSLNLDPAIHPTLVDASQFETAILNVVVNARDAMPQGGAITIATRNVNVTPDGGDTSAEIKPGAYAAVTVSDTGTGIAPEHLDRLFEPFFTTKDIGAGTGLGLSQVYGFVKESGGHIRIESEPGRGTAISMLLPRHEVVASGTTPSARPPTDQRLTLVSDRAAG
jgi:signal transduction histidine kinase